MELIKKNNLYVDMSPMTPLKNKPFNALNN